LAGLTAADPNTRLYQLAQDVKYVRISVPHDKLNRKLQITIAPETPSMAVWKIMRDALRQTPGVVEKRGTGPSTNLERTLQSMVDASRVAEGA
jgi:hypothetical protein